MVVSAIVEHQLLHDAGFDGSSCVKLLPTPSQLLWALIMCLHVLQTAPKLFAKLR
jgi:hypothetical protein